MTNRKVLALAIVGLGLLPVFIGVRFFPYSDYPMFAAVRKNLTTFQMVIKRKDETEKILGGRGIYPFHRIHLHQMIGTMNSKDSDSNWVRHFFNEARREDPEIVELAVQEVTFEFDKQTRQLKPVHVQELHRIRNE